jgi:hypothetical protein
MTQTGYRATPNPRAGTTDLGAATLPLVSGVRRIGGSVHLEPCSSQSIERCHLCAANV